jgi:hypothetical protein
LAGASGYNDKFTCNVDAQGSGQGTMAAAARVKPGPDGGVIVDDYAATPVRLSIKLGK